MAVARHHPAVGQSGLGQSRGGETGVLVRDLDAEEIDVRLRSGRIAQEQPLAGADLDFQRRDAAEDGLGCSRAGEAARTPSRCFERSSDGSILRSARRPTAFIPA